MLAEAIVYIYPWGEGGNMLLPISRSGRDNSTSMKTSNYFYSILLFNKCCLTRRQKLIVDFIARLFDVKRNKEKIRETSKEI